VRKHTQTEQNRDDREKYVPCTCQPNRNVFSCKHFVSSEIIKRQLFLVIRNCKDKEILYFADKCETGKIISDHLITCIIKILLFHVGMDICSSEIENFEKIVKSITENQSNGNKNLQQEIKSDKV
jgi:hypothetical protein